MQLKFALRNLLKRPFLTLIKVIGLSLALSGTVIIVLFLKNELSYDRFHKKSDRIYRLTTTSPNDFAGKSMARIYNPGYVPEMADYFPEIENYVRLIPVLGGIVKVDENFIKVNQAFQCDSTFFDLFDSKLLTGNPDKVLDQPGSMVVSESFAKKVFGKNDPTGQIVTLPGGQYYGDNIDFTIKGVMEDFPQNSHFHPEFIATPKDKTEFNRTAWTYLLLSDHANRDNILTGFKDFCSSHKQLLSEGEKTASLQKITDIHLHSDKLREIESNGNRSVIYTLAIAAILLMITAITNYANLNLGMTVFIDKYLHVTKVFGAAGWVNVKYFLCEGLIIAGICWIMSGSISAFAAMRIQKYFGLDLFQGNLAVILFVLSTFSLLSILSGILFLLRQGIGQMQSYAGNKNKFNRKGISKSLIIVQYTISISLIVTVLVIYRQTDYALESSMGAQADNMICFENVHSSVQSKFEVFKSELLKYNSIESVSASLDPPGGEANDMFPFTLEGYVKDETKKEDNLIGILPCDYSFAKTFDLTFLSGNDFSETNEDHEGAGEYIINESAMRRLHYTHPFQITGKEFSLVFDSDVIKIPKGRIIGVVKDFYLSGIRRPVEPLVLFKRKNLWLINIVVSIRPGMETTALSDIERVWKRMFPDHAFQYNYVSYIYRNIYQPEILQARLLAIFTLIALVVSAMGLLGMSLLAAQRRMKEIAIRKVNGANVSQMMALLSWDFVKWIMISFAIAVPLAYFAMTKWLGNFAYKTTISWWIFALAGVAAMVLALLTISVQSWKAATRNPVETLRNQ